MKEARKNLDAFFVSTEFGKGVWLGAAVPCLKKTRTLELIHGSLPMISLKPEVNCRFIFQDIWQ